MFRHTRNAVGGASGHSHPRPPNRHTKRRHYATRNSIFHRTHTHTQRDAARGTRTQRESLAAIDRSERHEQTQDRQCNWFHFVLSLHFIFSLRCCLFFLRFLLLLGQPSSRPLSSQPLGFRSFRLRRCRATEAELGASDALRRRSIRCTRCGRRRGRACGCEQKLITRPFSAGRRRRRRLSIRCSLPPPHAKRVPLAPCLAFASARRSHLPLAD